jgi:hypothetical protein
MKTADVVAVVALLGAVGVLWYAKKAGDKK